MGTRLERDHQGATFGRGTGHGGLGFGMRASGACVARDGQHVAIVSSHHRTDTRIGVGAVGTGDLDRPLHESSSGVLRVG